MIFPGLLAYLKQLMASPPSPSPRPELLRPGLIAQRVNDERARLGLGPCRFSKKLGDMAQEWADTIRNHGLISNGFIAGRIIYQIGKPNSTLDDIFAAWRHGPQRATILGRFNQIGVGVSVSDDGTITWCIDFDYTCR